MSTTFSLKARPVRQYPQGDTTTFVTRPRPGPFGGVRMRLVATVFLLLAPAGPVLYLWELPWAEFALGMVALVAAWLGGELFVRRQVHELIQVTNALRKGNLRARTTIAVQHDELGELAQSIDLMAHALQRRETKREHDADDMRMRAQQQTGAAALGQLALRCTDYETLLQQAVTLIAHSVEVEFCDVLAVENHGRALRLRCGHGWPTNTENETEFLVSPVSLSGFVFTRIEPATVNDWEQERRFRKPTLYDEHKVRSSACVPIGGRNKTFGLLSVHSCQPRNFSGDDIQFLLTAANHLATAAERLQTEVEVMRHASFAQLNPNAAMELAMDGTMTYCNEAALRLALSVGLDHPLLLLPRNIQEIIRTSLSTSGGPVRLETRVGKRCLHWAFHPVPASKKVHCYVEDRTEQRDLQERLQQSQKMEALGQLAAGVAHDFNNMLTVIQGHSGMLLAKAQGRSELVESSQAIHFAAERAAALTKQLLVFSRKSVIQLKLLDLGDCVSQMVLMLKRLMGEQIDLDFDCPEELPMVRGDSGMIEQVLMNLAVNARDAMPKGGTLSIRINPVELPAISPQPHVQSRPGSFVCLRVSDTGCGMSHEIQRHCFEPFYTTKEVGKGTGLGLATVYGIVEQHEGWIEVESDPGEGTAFNIYLPASEVIRKRQNQDTGPAREIRGGHETVLLVEDESTLRDMAALILQEYGYTVLKSSNGVEALSQWMLNKDEIDVVVTDMVMPEGLSGLELAEHLLQERPDLKLIFTSGYSVEDIGTGLAKHANTRFLEKPYARHALAHAVREVLDASPAGSDVAGETPATETEEFSFDSIVRN